MPTRIGDTVRTNRIKSGQTEKQLAKKTGLAESFIKEVELGKRIPSEDQVRRILKACGSEDNVGTEITAASEPVSAAPAPRPVLRQSKPLPKPAPVDPKATGDAWLAALGGLLKKVPVFDELSRQCGEELVPAPDKKIQGYPSEKVYMFRLPDETLAGYAMHRGDLLLVVPDKQPADNAFMLLSIKGVSCVRRVKKLDDSHLMLSSFDREPRMETVLWGEVRLMGRCVRLTRIL